MTDSRRLCECGCGQQTNVVGGKANRFIRGHNMSVPKESISNLARTCEWCGALFSPHPNEDRTTFNRRRTCSGACKGARLGAIRREQTLAKRRLQSREIGEVPLTRGMYAYVSPEDFDLVMQHCWHARQAADSDRTYAHTRIDGKQVKMHRLILGVADDESVDHVDRDGLNNRRENIRVVTASQNAMNRKPYANTASGYKGVVPVGNKWRVMFRKKHVGLYNTPEDAARAYDALAREHFGEHARLNFPDNPRRKVA